MKAEAAEIFKKLLKNGWIDRKDDALIWNALDDENVLADIDVLKDSFAFDTVRTNDRYYLIPLQENDLFLKSNVDYRKDIKAGNETRTKDLYLLNYLAIYIIYLFFKGEGASYQCRDFITRGDLLEQFTLHCEETENAETDAMDGFSESFVSLAQSWLSKTEGPTDSTKATTEKNGVINRILLKFKADGLFYEYEEKIYPTQKMTDLMPYFLRKDRINEINAWVEEVEKNASNQ